VCSSEAPAKFRAAYIRELMLLDGTRYEFVKRACR
jgi:hypothetical protein